MDDGRQDDKIGKDDCSKHNDGVHRNYNRTGRRCQVVCQAASIDVAVELVHGWLLIDVAIVLLRGWLIIEP